MPKRTVPIILLILSLFFTAHSARAQEDNPPEKIPQNAKVTDRKRKLILTIHFTPQNRGYYRTHIEYSIEVNNNGIRN